MRILVSGASGLIGGALTPALQAEGHTVVRLVRRAVADASERFWEPALGELRADDVNAFDAAVHLSGENVAAGHWTAARKERILRSRVESTRLLVARLARAGRPPRVFVCASATGYYGDRGDEVLTEASGPGGGFLAEVCQAWEEEAKIAASVGIRTVRLRFGVVLSPAGGALAKVLPLFRAGLGGKLGAGRQWLSWIALGDAVRAIAHVIASESCDGAVNAVAPGEVRNEEFARALGRVLGHRTTLGVPALALKLRFGQMAEETMLASQRVKAERLEQAKFVFGQPELESALRQMLGGVSRAG